MSTLLEMLEDHDTYHVTDMKGISSRVDTDVGSCRAFHQFLLCAWHDVLNHTPPFKFLYEIFHNMFFFIFFYVAAS